MANRSTALKYRPETPPVPPWGGLGCLVVSLAAAALASPADGLAQRPAASPGVIDREYLLKAAFLYKFATYVDWPDKAFADPASPFVIAVLGPDPVGASLRQIAAVRKIGQRKIQVRRFSTLEDLDDCHILFIPRAVDRETQAEALRRLTGKGVLLVGETPEFLRQGGVIDFVVRENRIHMYISQPAYQREGLTVSAHLLRVATVLK